VNLGLQNKETHAKLGSFWCCKAASIFVVLLTIYRKQRAEKEGMLPYMCGMNTIAAAPSHDHALSVQDVDATWVESS